jgi:hypothetical protein
MSATRPDEESSWPRVANQGCSVRFAASTRTPSHKPRPISAAELFSQLTSKPRLKSDQPMLA